MRENKKIYFASDFHLGIPNNLQSNEREKVIVAWLDKVKTDAKEIYLVGDLFDFWFEYKYTVPKGCIRFLGKIAELVEHGIQFHLFTGNHDMWMFDYLEKEFGITINRKPITKEINDKIFLIGHGDGLGPGDKKYKLIKRFFANKFCQWLFARLHPNFGFSIAHYWSKKSREKEMLGNHDFLGENKEWLIIYANEILKKRHVDYFIFGHRHLPIEHQLNEKSTYINLGDWINHYTYGVFDGKKLTLENFDYKRVK